MQETEALDHRKKCINMNMAHTAVDTKTHACIHGSQIPASEHTGDSSIPMCDTGHSRSTPATCHILGFHSTLFITFMHMLNSKWRSDTLKQIVQCINTVRGRLVTSDCISVSHTDHRETDRIWTREFRCSGQYSAV